MSGRLSRSAWSVGDQAASSLSNLVFGIIAARNLDVAAFGAIGLALALYSIAQNAVRGLTSTPLVVTSTGKSQRRIARNASQSLTLTVGAAGAVSLALVAALPFVEAVGRGPLIAMAIGLPFLLAQDHLRFVFVTMGKPHLAALSDGVWLVLILPGLFIRHDQWHDSGFAITLAWVAAATASLVFGLLTVRIVPTTFGVARLARKQWALAWRFCLESSVVGISRQASILTTVAVIGVAGGSGIRGAQMLMGPYTVISGGLTFMATAEATRILTRSDTRATRFLVTLSATLALSALVVSFGFWIAPASIGEALLGASWQQGHDTVLIYGLWAGAAGIQAGAYVGLNALQAATSSLSLRAAFMALTVGACLIGAVLGGAALALCFAAVVELLSAIAAWYALSRHLRQRRIASIPQPVQV